MTRLGKEANETISQTESLLTHSLGIFIISNLFLYIESKAMRILV